LVDGIGVPIKDQPTTQVIIDGAELQRNNQMSVNIDGVEHADIEVQSGYTLGAVTGVNLVGGPFRSTKQGAVGKTNMYTGSMQSEGNGTSFNVSAGAQFLVQHNWHDNGATSPRNFILSGSGTVTEQGGQVGMNSTTPFEIDDFDGKVALLGLTVQVEPGFVLNPGVGKTQLFTLGNVGWTPNNFLPASVGNITVENMFNVYFDSVGGHEIPSQDTPDVQWVRQMFAQTRSEYPAPRTAMNSIGSRKNLIRVQVMGFATAIHVKPVAPPAQLYYTLATTGGNLSNLTPVAQGCPGAVLSSDDAGAWHLLDTGEGDFMLADVTSSNVLGLFLGSNGTSVLGMEPVGPPQFNQRWMIRDVGDGRKTFVNRGTGQFLSWDPGTCPQLNASGDAESAKWIMTAN
jgi:hypothetical protein